MYIKRNLLIVLSLGILSGAFLGNLYGQERGRTPPIWSSRYLEYVPVWSEKNYRYVSDDKLISQFYQSKISMDNFIDAIKLLKKECEPYNLYYWCSPDNSEKESKLVYQYYDGNEVGDTVLIPAPVIIDEAILRKRVGDTEIKGELVHAISLEDITGKEDLVRGFAKYLLDKDLLAGSSCLVEIDVRTIQGTKETFVQIKLSGVQGEEQNLESYFIYYPNMPPNIKLAPKFGMERELVQLNYDWYFMKGIEKK